MILFAVHDCEIGYRESQRKRAPRCHAPHAIGKSLHLRSSDNVDLAVSGIPNRFAKEIVFLHVKNPSYHCAAVTSITYLNEKINRGVL